MKVLGLVPGLVLLGFCSQASSLVKDKVFSGDCKKFFAFPPAGLPSSGGGGGQYQEICQKQGNVFRFATLYDTFSKIPVFSAYQYQSFNKKPRDYPWLIEPQLDDPSVTKFNGEMQPDNSDTLPDIVRGTNQALNSDYKASKFHKGHLVPVYHRKGNPAVKATFTLTNAAPQDPAFNTGKWKAHEYHVAKDMDAKCLNKGWKAFIVTGVVPGRNTMGNNVKVPSHFWSAYCCVDSNRKPKLARGFLGKNVNKKLKDMTVIELDVNLNKLYGFAGFKIFGGKCN